MTAERRVLLFSPVLGFDPPSGDTSYTDALLAEPPPGVVYTTYRQALDDGRVRLRGRKPWNGMVDRRDLPLFALRSTELALRRAQLMFREYIGYVSVAPGEFDLVHQHLATIRQIGTPLPVVSGAGYPLPELYRSRELWSPAHLAVATGLERVLDGLVDAHNPWLRPSGTNIMTVYGEHFRRWLVQRGVPPGQVRLSSTALTDLRLPDRSSDGWTLGIFARDFVRKGGDVGLEAFRQLQREDPRWRVIVVTRQADADEHVAPGPGIEVYTDAPRELILRELLPRTDILLAPTRSDCGAPYTVLEALQAGTAVVTSDIPWLDDRLGPPAVERVRPDPAAVADAVRRISARSTQEEGTAAAARDLWRREFTMERLHADLGRAYDDALAGAARAGRRQRPPTPERPRPSVLVVARSFDLSRAPYDGFVSRHRRIVADLATTAEVTVLSIRSQPDDPAVADVPGVTSYLEVALPPRPQGRLRRLFDAIRQARGHESDAERRVADVAAKAEVGVAVTIGPWLDVEYRPIWRRWPSVHFFEEDLLQMPELAPQSRRARGLRRLESLLHRVAPGQPATVVSISRIEQRRAERRFPSSTQAYMPFTLDPTEWPPTAHRAGGRWIVAVGNFAERRNADGLAEVLSEVSRRPADGSPLEFRIISGAGVDDVLAPFLDRPWVTLEAPLADARDAYSDAWAAIVPARRVTGQKTTILQAWACGVPVVCSPESGATIGFDQGMLVGAGGGEVVTRLEELRRDTDLQERMAAEGADILRRHFDPGAEAPAVRAMIRVLGDHVAG